MDNSLCHYGKKGMHWGVKRGKKNSTNNVTTNTPRQKTMSEMSNEELAAYNQRKQLENTYLSYQPKPRVSKGKKFTHAVVTKVIAPVAIDVGKAYLKSNLNAKLNIKEPPKNKT